MIKKENTSSIPILQKLGRYVESDLVQKIIIGLILGLLFGIVAASQGWGKFTTDWIAPFGKIFINPWVAKAEI